MADYRLYTKKQYFSHLVNRFGACGIGDRILLMTMSFEPDEPEIKDIIDALLIAAREGADIMIGIDAMAFMGRNGKPGTFGNYFGPLVFHQDLPPKLQTPYALKQKYLADLDGYTNVKAVITNKPRHRLSLRIAGRSHIKTAIINDEVLLGGCNLDYPTNIDTMIGFTSLNVANKLHATLGAALSDGSVRHSLEGVDTAVTIDGYTKLILDAGVPGQSLIFEQALRLIDSARDWLTMTCQFFPNGITAQRLVAAHNRGVKVKILYPPVSRYQTADKPLQSFSRLIEHCRVPNVLFSDQLPSSEPYIHAKVIVCDAGAVIGSHNYVSPGVELGTAEMALFSHDEMLINHLRQHFDNI